MYIYTYIHTQGSHTLVPSVLFQARLRSPYSVRSTHSTQKVAHMCTPYSTSTVRPHVHPTVRPPMYTPHTPMYFLQTPMYTLQYAHMYTSLYVQENSSRKQSCVRPFTHDKDTDIKHFYHVIGSVRANARMWGCVCICVFCNIKPGTSLSEIMMWTPIALLVHTCSSVCSIHIKKTQVHPLTRHLRLLQIREG